MRFTSRPGSRARSSVAWLGSALIVVGGALNLMAFVALGATDRAPVQTVPSEHRFTVADSFAAQGLASPDARRRPKVRAAGRIENARSGMLSHAPASWRLSSGKLTAGDESRSVARKEGAPVRIAGVSTVEGPASNASSSSQTTVPFVDMPAATHITIAAVGIDADIVEVTSTKTEIEGRTVFNWQVADWAVGHHDLSADPGEGGNIVLSGHDDVRGEVFRGLHDITLGDLVLLTSESGIHPYIVTEIHVREYRHASLAEQIAAGQFTMPMPEERLTLVTCWPYGVDTHRIVVVAKPLIARDGRPLNVGPSPGE